MGPAFGLRRSILSGPAIAMALVLATISCGGNTPAATSAPAASASAVAAKRATTAPTSQPTPVGKLLVDLAAPNPAYADIYTAEAMDLFKKAGVEVTIEAAGAQVGTNVASGRADLGMVGTTAAFAPTAAGRPTTILYAFLTGPETGGIVVNAKSSFTDLMSLQGKRVAVLGVGSSSFGAAEAFSGYIKSKGGTPLQVVSLADKPAIIAQLLSGQVDAAVGSVNFFAADITAGRAKLLVDPSSQFVKDLFGGDIADTAVWGLQKNVEAKRPAVVRFLAALRQADEYLHKNSLDDIAATLKKDPAFANLSVAEIKDGAKWEQPFWASTLGAISEADWKKSLDQFSLWNLGLDVHGPQFSYQKIVDMSYLDEAVKLGQ